MLYEVITLGFGRIAMEVKLLCRRWRQWEGIIRQCCGVITSYSIHYTKLYENFGKGKHADVYVSVMEALRHGAMANDVNLKIEMVDSSELNLEKL